MCGIVGSISKNSLKHILSGLTRLEYRGYDSAGIATLSNGTLEIRKAVGKLTNLQAKVEEDSHLSTADIAIGHSRWATHGVPSETNAHPHVVGQVAVVHNGIIENYQTLRNNLPDINFQSDTDTEVIPALIHTYRQQGMDHTSAVQETVKNLEGAFACAILCADAPETLIATRRSAPLCIGLGQGENYIASDPLALAEQTNKFIFLEDDDIAVLTADKVEILRPDGTHALRQPEVIDVSGALAGKAGYKHFMLKEMHEQPAVVSQILSTYLTPDHSNLNLPPLPFQLHNVPQINIVACGTAYYAGMVSKYQFEQLARIPVNVDMASEFRYRQPPYVEGGLFIAVSQSGETADTLAALENAKAHGQHILVLTNSPNSSMARAADVVMKLLAGPEIAVASTKAFMAMVTTLALVALQAAHAKGESITAHLKALCTLPSKLEQTLAMAPQTEKLAQNIMHAPSMLYLGRGTLQPLAYEGALKMKEISYIHAEAYASGEMKHGPIALVDENLPVVNLATSTDKLFEKTISNMKEIEARRGQVILLTDAKGRETLDDSIKKSATILTVPDAPALLTPMVFTVPLQLMAYHVAVAKGTDVDQPRNLAKSVTVE